MKNHLTNIPRGGIIKTLLDNDETNRRERRGFVNRFCLTDYDEYTVMHCPTKESAEIFLNFLSSLGKKWVSGEAYEYNDRWDYYEFDTCYNFSTGTYGDLGYYKEESDYSYAILEFDDFDWGEQCNENGELAPPMSFEEMFYGISVENQTSV